MNMKHVGAGLAILVTLVVLALMTPAQAGGGRSGAAATVADITQLPAEMLPATQLTFRASFTDAENDTAATANMVIDGVATAMVAESASDTNTTDGKTYTYATSLAGGAHTYSYAFSDGTNWTNTTAKTFTVNWAPAAGDWVISGPQVVANANIELKGNLTVPTGASLELRNTTIKFNGATDGQYRVEVQSGGSLKAYNGTVFSRATGAKNYNFIVKPGATAFELHNSEVWYCGWAGATNNLTGLFTEAANSLVENCLVANGYQGVIQEDGKLVIKGTTVKDSTRHNLEGTNANIEATDCTFQHSVDACNVEFFTGTTATVTNCLITDNGHNGFWIKTGVTATIQGCHIEKSHQSAIWLDDHCTLTVKDTRCDNNTMEGAWINGSCTVTMTNVIFEDNTLNGTWISGSTVTMNNVTVRNNKLDGVYFIATTLIMDKCTVDSNGMQGVAGFDSKCTFTNNYCRNSFKHNYETTNSTTTMDNCKFDASRDACNVEFFVNSKATVKNTNITGAGHNCFWLSDHVEVSIEGGDFSLSPNNVIWANLSSKVTVKNCVLHNAQKDGIWAADSTIIVDGCTIKDNGLEGGAMGWGIEVENCSLTVTGTTFTNNPKGQISAKNYLTVKALDDKGKALSGATVKITDQNKNATFSGKSDASGGIGGPMLLTSYIQDNTGKKTDYTYTISVSKGDLEGSQKVPLTGAQSVELKTKAKAKPQPGFEALVLLVTLISVAVLVAGRKRK
jgi:hypothetical protein